MIHFEDIRNYRAQRKEVRDTLSEENNNFW